MINGSVFYLFLRNIAKNLQYSILASSENAIVLYIMNKVLAFKGTIVKKNGIDMSLENYNILKLFRFPIQGTAFKIYVVL